MNKNWKSKYLVYLIIIGFSIVIISKNNVNLNLEQVNNTDVVKDKFGTKLKQASGYWDPQITKPVGDGPRSVFIEDTNNDGYNDICTANFDDDNVSILLWNNTIGDWNPLITRSVGNTPFSVFIEDTNNDGYNDICTANLIDDTISILLWNNTIGDWNPLITRSVGNAPYSVFIEDTNNDGYNDICTANFYDNTTSILLIIIQLVIGTH